MYGREIARTRHWPMDLALDATGERVYLLNYHPGRRWWLPHRGSVSVLDTETGRESSILGFRRPFHCSLAADPSGTYLYVASTARNRMWVIDVARGRRVARIRVGARPEAVLADPGGDRVYVANTDGNTVSVIAMPARTVVATVDSGGAPCALALAGGSLLVANRHEPSVTAVDIERLVPTEAVPLDGVPQALCTSPSGDRLYVATRHPPGIRVFRTGPLQPIGTIALSTRFARPPILPTDPPQQPEPSALAVSRDGTHLVVGLFEPGSIQVIDLARERIVDEYHLERDRFDGPTGIVADPRTDRFYVASVGHDLTVLC